MHNHIERQLDRTLYEVLVLIEMLRDDLRDCDAPEVVPKPPLD